MVYGSVHIVNNTNSYTYSFKHQPRTPPPPHQLQSANTDTVPDTDILGIFFSQLAFALL